MVRAMRWLVTLAVMVQVAHADPAADVTKAFQAFVERGGTSEPGLALFTGGAAIKKIFSKWQISSDPSPNADPMNAAGGIAPDGQLMWLSFGVQGTDRVCTMYRAMFILAKEKAGWRIVQHHYSRPVSL